ncbi:ankyrin repeat domain-containing protein [Oceanispirochaeta crateris]|uniref:Ankyrin repeat domain-containing protein n=1 Tax=Oceanispirochaeta crateris TaxID=2518645 RepID=A0A5C1QJJ6_9SPIO|nr:ankyrin repeat domain-containing protein [Oceanispirochaeta crateris]QEN07488.1 ankyrin repeat domain-containing protein [Oceanispirochaeta crateris]
MKFSVFCSESIKSQLTSLRLSLDDYYIEYQTVLFDKTETISNAMPHLIQALRSSSFYLLIPSTEDLDSQWLSFVVGYGQMNTKNTIFLYQDDFPSNWLSEFPLAKDIPSLRTILNSHLPQWNDQMKKNLALSTLKERLKEHTHQDFVRTVIEGDRFMTAVFLDAGFEVNKLSADQVTLLCAAARRGHNSIVKILFEAGADINQVSKDRNNTPLMDAASEGHVELVRFFIDNGAELEIKSKSGQTALVLASGNGQIDCAEILINAGANCDEKDSMGLSARKYAQLYQVENLLKLMPPAPIQENQQ